MLIVIVIYNKELDGLELVFNAAAKGQHIFVYDNSLISQELSVAASNCIHYEHDPENNGVSRAYNRAAIKAKELGLNKILILDQDTAFDLNMLKKYENAYEKHGDSFIYAPVVKNEVGDKIYSPAHFKNFVGKVQLIDDFTFNQIYSLDGKSLINSGLMIPLRVFDLIGGYNEKLKLDFSDVYFIEKYKRFVSNNVILVNATLRHSISGDEGLDYERELNRFKFYCHATRETSRSLGTLIIWSPVRRLLRLVIKYKKISFVKIFWKFYIKGVPA